MTSGMAHIAMWLLVGLVVGVLGSWFTGTSAWAGTLVNIAVTTLGAALANSLVHPLSGALPDSSTRKQAIDASCIAVAVLGAMAVLVLVHMVRRSAA